MNWYIASNDKKKEIDGKQYVICPKDCGSPSGSMGSFFDLKKRDGELWIEKSRVKSYNETCDSILEDLEKWDKEKNENKQKNKEKDKKVAQISQEFIGADGFSNHTDYNQLSKTRNVENQYLPPTITQNSMGSQSPLGVQPSLYRKVEKCESCNLPLEEFEWKGATFKGKGGEKEEIYKCKNCGYTNYYSQNITRKKNRIRKKRSKINNILYKNANPFSGFSNWPSSYNPANQPWGRLDLSVDQRVIPWYKVKDGFENTFDSDKQKNNDEYKTIEVKGKDGQIKKIKIKKKNTGGDAIQPSNTYKNKGNLKKQPRYNPDKGKNKTDNPGSWPHNRNPTADQGWYQSPYGPNTFNSDNRLRATDWYTHLNERMRSPSGLSKPY